MFKHALWIKRMQMNVNLRFRKSTAKIKHHGNQLDYANVRRYRQAKKVATSHQVWSKLIRFSREPLDIQQGVTQNKLS